MRSEPREFSPASPATPVRKARKPRFPTVVGLLLASIVLWWGVARLHIWPPIFVPSPEAVWDKLIRTSSVQDGLRGYSGWLLYEHLWATTRRVLEGFGFAVLVGVPAGLVLGGWPRLGNAIEPFVTFLRSLPPLAYFSLLIIWFGIEETPKVVLLFLSAVPPIVLATSEAVRGVHPDRLLAARSLGANRFQLISEVVLPSILPELLTGLRVGLGVAFTTVVAAETVNGMPGIGGMVRDAQRYNQTDVVVLGILLIGLLGVVLDQLIRWLDRLLVPWRGKA